jgi:hypothetical protein
MIFYTYLFNYLILKFMLKFIKPLVYYKYQLKDLDATYKNFNINPKERV